MSTEYIVVTTATADQTAFAAMLVQKNIPLTENYQHLPRHYRVRLSAAQAKSLARHPDVCLIENAEGLVKFGEVQAIAVGPDGFGDNWGLARIDQRAWDDSVWFPYSGDYRFHRRGSNVDLYVVDTGVRLSHADFGGRAKPLYDAFAGQTDPNRCLDTEGHGTHVASTAAGIRYGVAKNATIQAVKVFQGPNTTIAAIVGGINAVLQHHNAKKAAGSAAPSVMNLSLGGPAIASLEQAVNDCIDAGIVVVVAAGNEGQNLDPVTYNVMPAEIKRAITVGATDIQDWVAPFSNYGSILDVFAPGHYIVAAAHDSDTGVSMKSGTSMAAPHVAGVAALHAEGQGIGRDAAYVARIHDLVANSATANTLQMSAPVRAAGSPDKLLFAYYVAAEVTQPAAVEPITVTPPVRRWRTNRQHNVPVLSREIDKLERLYRTIGVAVMTIDQKLAEVEAAASAMVAKRGVERVRAFEKFLAKVQECMVLIEKYRGGAGVSTASVVAIQ